ncbi:hypothetical protein GCM10020295_73400 [Streptomyces cinereospinus]
MPHDVRFGLLLDTPVSRPLEYARERHLRRVRAKGLVRSEAGFGEYPRDLPRSTRWRVPRAFGQRVRRNVRR